MEGGYAGQTGGGTKFELSDIGDYKSSDDIFVIANASVFTLLLLTIATRIGGLGGNILNTYFNMFGLEGILSNTMLFVVLIQLTRYLYTTFYTSYGKAWSPFVFLCFLAVIVSLTDVFFYYGVINVVPPGTNEMVDVLRAYSKNSTLHILGGHIGILVLTALATMIMCDMGLITRLLSIAVILFLFPFILSIVAKKPAPSPPPPKKEEFVDSRGFSM
jgi:hypothetical protein